MWHQELLNPLILKVIQPDQCKAEQFLDVVLKEMAQIAYPAPIPTDVLLNLIRTMYKFYEGVENNSVYLFDFTRNLFGLSLVYIKNSFDLELWGEDFKGICYNPQMLEYLNYDFNIFKKLISDFKALEAITLTKIHHSLRSDFNHFRCILSKNEFKHLSSFHYAIDDKDGFANLVFH